MVVHRISDDIHCLAPPGGENFIQPPDSLTPCVTFKRARTVFVCKQFLALVLIELTKENTLHQYWRRANKVCITAQKNKLWCSCAICNWASPRILLAPCLHCQMVKKWDSLRYSLSSSCSLDSSIIFGNLAGRGTSEILNGLQLDPGLVASQLLGLQ